MEQGEGAAALKEGAAGLLAGEGRILAEREESPIERKCAPLSDQSLTLLLDALCFQQATALLLALELKSEETSAHSLRVASLSLRIGRKLALSPEQLATLKYGALLHDIGKLSVPESILEKTERLSEEEWMRLRLHPSRGENLLATLDFPQPICQAVGQHHESFNGSGYPFGIRGLAISFEARIIAVADTFDTIFKGRCFRKAECYEVALHEVVSCSGSQFDPVVVNALVGIPKEEIEAL
ncbi:MAG: HD domain-containing protein [Pyrinomonadaceae bacterium]|nr:HD domain-containing protein [Pyrinomonadaceae bacterium]